MSFLELADYLVAGFTLLAGYRAGRVKGPRPKMFHRSTATCACKHGYGTHENDGGKCHGDSKRANGWDSYGNANHWIHVPCPCMSYDGPDPGIVKMMSE